MGDGKPLEIILGRKFKFELWEAIVQCMAIGEVSQFTVSKDLLTQYPFVSKTLRDVHLPADKRNNHRCVMTAHQHGIGHDDLNRLMSNPADLEFTIELVKVEEPNEYQKESWQMNELEQVDRVHELKELGNAEYKSSNHEAASKMYAEAIGILERLMIKEKPQSEEWNDLNKMKIPLLSNYSQCMMAKGDFYAVIEHCTSVLKIEPDNVKALFRRAKAHIGAWNPTEARADFERVVKLDHGLAASVKKEIDVLDQLIKSKDGTDKQLFKGMFSK
ncbi:AH receptor-interacting protein isoform X2 [Photinus pyralis]|nr:AH receptor-interacting protein isoform X2 [Photinus pyralis]